MNAESQIGEHNSHQIESKSNSLDDQLEVLDVNLVKALTSKRIPTRLSRLIGTLSLPTAAIVGEVLSTVRLVAEDPSQIDLNIKVARAALNAAISLLPSNFAPITSDKPWVLLAASAGAVLGTLTLGGVGRLAADRFVNRSETRERLRANARLRLKEGLESISRSDHSVVVWFEKDDVVERMRNLFHLPVLLSNGKNPYEGVGEHEWPGFPMHVIGESGESDVLERASIQSARELVLFPFSSDELLVQNPESAEKHQRQMKRALDTVVTAIAVRKKWNIKSDPLDVVFVAPEDFRIQGSELDASQGSIRPTQSIQEYLKAFIDNFGATYNLTLQDIEDHIHIVDPRKSLVEMMADMKDKQIAISGDAHVREQLGAYLRSQGFKVGLYSGSTEFVLAYEQDDQAVVIHPAILTGTQQGLGFFVDQEGRVVPVTPSTAKILTPIDRVSDLKGEVLFSIPLDMESVMRKSVSEQLQEMHKKRLLKETEQKKRTFYVSHRDQDLQRGDPFARGGMEVHGRIRDFLNEVIPLLTTIDQLKISNGNGILQLAKVFSEIKSKSMTEPGFLGKRIDVGEVRVFRKGGEFEFKIHTDKHGRSHITLLYTVSDNQIMYLKSHGNGYERKVCRARIVVEKDGSVHLKAARVIRDQQSASRPGKSKNSYTMSASAFDQLGALEELTDALADWNESHGLPFNRPVRRYRHQVIASPITVIRTKSIK